MREWNSDLEALLDNWRHQINGIDKIYRQHGVKYRNYHQILGVFLIIFDVTSLMAILSPVFEGNGPSFKLSIGIGIVEFIHLLVSGFDRFMNYSSRSEAFFDAAKDYNALTRIIEVTLSLPRHDRDDPREVMTSIRKEFDHIQDGSPDIIQETLHLDMMIKQTGNRELSDGGILGAQAANSNEESGSEQKINLAHTCKFKADLRENKVKAAKDIQRNKRLKALEYQWGRLQMAEEDYPDTND